MDMNQYLSVFIDEGREHLQNLNDKMLELEENSDDPEVINEIFRSAHTLKGMSGQMGFENMMNLTHKMENVLDALRHGNIHVSSNMIDVLFEAIDHLEAMIDQIAQGESDNRDVQATVEKLKAIEKGGTAHPQASEDQAPAAVTAGKKESGLAFNDYDKMAIQQAASEQLNVFVIEVTLREDCVLKAARALMVFNALENLGDLVKAVPVVEDIEQEAFDHQFTLVVATEKKAEDIEAAVMSVSEISSAEVRPVTAEEIDMAHDEPSAASNDEHTEKSSDQAKSEKSPAGRNNGQSGKKRKQVVNKTIRVNLERLDHLMNLFEEMIIDRSRLEKIAVSLDNSELKETSDTIKRVSDQLQETILNLRMEPIEQVFNRFPRMVRSLSKELNKKVNLVIRGAETEIDRAVIDEIGDPIMHLMRNSLDHGIEHADERTRNGKPEEGTVVLSAYHSGNHVFIEIEDDGAGINRKKVLAKAIENGLVKEEEADQLTDKDVYHLLFASGFSTADKISDISGRGVGLDVVESKIHALNGHVSIDSAPGKGTKFTIKLPLTLSIINAMMIRIGNEFYAVPISSIVETTLVREVRVKFINQRQVMTFREKVVPLVDLHDYLKVPESGEQDHAGHGAIVIVKHGEKMVGMIADELLGYQDIVIKPLGQYLDKVEGFSGATILGDGEVALILDCQSIVNYQPAILLQKNQIGG